VDRHAAEKPNVLFLLVDTLRSDHLGCYGYTRDTSPNIDHFAESCVVFTNVRAQATCTFPSVNSLLTSRYPFRFIGQKQGNIGIPDDVPTLADAFKALGYGTFAISASPIVCSHPTDLNPHGGFGNGFDSSNAEVELFDIVNDPDECTNLYSPQHPDGMRLRRAMDQWFHDQRSLARQQRLEVDADTQELLHSLGYVQ